MKAPKHVMRAVDEALTFARASDGTARLRVGNQDLNLRLIGEGSFTEAYRDVDPPRNVYAFVDASSRDKDVVESAHRRYPENPHIPAVERLGRAGRENVYRMPHYTVPPPSRSKAEEDRLRLWACEEGARASRFGRAQNEDVLRCARHWEVTPGVVGALQALSTEARKRSKNYLFEFPKFNVGADEAGNLVLLDVLYNELR